MWIFVISLCAVGLVIYFNKKKKLSKPEYQERFLRVEEFLSELESCKKDYFRNSKKEYLREEYKEVYKELSRRSYKRLTDSSVKEFQNVYANLDVLVKKWNSEYVDKELTDSMQLLNDIDGKSLDEQQRNAVVVDEDNNLVIAGAGSGKTLTISAKVKYLVERKNIKPEEILLISFTKKAAEEMQERIANKLNINVEAKTFHKLGLDIVCEEYGERPDICDGLKEVLDEYLDNEVLENAIVAKNLVDFFGIYLTTPKDLQDFDNLGEVYEHRKGIDFETIKSKIESRKTELRKDKFTIKGEKVKSFEEVIIANFLYLNGVKYTYEKKYPYESDDKFKKKYEPDFYLDDYDIYLEHFGITEDERVPWLSEIEEQKYLEGIKWKREMHKKHGTTLVETYSYYNKKGILNIELEKILKSKGIPSQDVDYLEIYNGLFNNQEDMRFSEFKKLIQTFIGLFKSKGYDLNTFDSLTIFSENIKNEFKKTRMRMFLSIVKPIYLSYQKKLQDSGAIDFNDMINNATQIISEGKGDFNYKYIIVDEYQDISMSRFNLVRALKNRTNSKVMAVGDDWQSIYRFAGSEIDLFTNFSKYLGYSELLRIEKTYRNSQELIDIASKFVIKNPKQLTKNLKSDMHHSNPIRILEYKEDIRGALKRAIEEIVHLNGENEEILILGRYNFDLKMICVENDIPSNLSLKDDFIIHRKMGLFAILCG